jgi:hypothetical protein
MRMQRPLNVLKDALENISIMEIHVISCIVSAKLRL